MSGGTAPTGVGVAGVAAIDLRTLLGFSGARPAACAGRPDAGGHFPRAEG